MELRGDHTSVPVGGDPVRENGGVPSGKKEDDGSGGRRDGEGNQEKRRRSGYRLAVSVTGLEGSLRKAPGNAAYGLEQKGGKRNGTRGLTVRSDLVSSPLPRSKANLIKTTGSLE